MSQDPHRRTPAMAPHVQAAIQRAAAGGPVPAQPQSRRAAPALAPHVQAAIGGRPAAASSSPAQPSRPGAPPLAPHVQAAIQQTRTAAQAKPDGGRNEESSGGGETQRPATSALHAVTDFVSYVDLKSTGSPPPPPRRPVYALHCNDGSCAVQDVKTGRIREAGDLFGGFVRMDKGSTVYVSPRAAAGAPGDSHPTIASGTPEWQAGKRTVVAAGEIGIRGNAIVGHNDKTGHFQTRKNLRQSGLPAEKYHPFTEDPTEWYHT